MNNIQINLLFDDTIIPKEPYIIDVLVDVNPNDTDTGSGERMFFKTEKEQQNKYVQLMASIADGTYNG